MVMVSPKLCPQATWEFEAEILVLHHPTTISPRYQAMGEYTAPGERRRRRKRRRRLLLTGTIFTKAPPSPQSTAGAYGRPPPSCP